MNRSAQVWSYSLMLGIVIIILGLALSPVIKESVDNARNVTVGDTIGLDCQNDSISNFDKATCTVTDFSIFYFGAGLVLIGGIVLTAKVVFL